MAKVIAVANQKVELENNYSNQFEFLRGIQGKKSPSY